MVVGDAYYTAKNELFTAEQHALRHNHFQVHVDHPYKYLLHMVGTLLDGQLGVTAGGRSDSHVTDGDRWQPHAETHNGSSPAPPAAAEQGHGERGESSAMSSVARVAVTLLHDALTATAVGCEQEPEILAAAAVVAALQLVEAASSSSSSGGGGVAAAGPGWDAAAIAERLVAATGLSAERVATLAVHLIQLSRSLAEAITGG